MSDNNSNITRILLFFVLLLIALLNLGPLVGIFINFPQGDTDIATYDIEQEEIQEVLSTVEGKPVLAAKYYEFDNTEFLSYLVLDERQVKEDQYEVNITIHHLNLQSETSRNYSLWSGTVNQAGDRFAFLGLEVYQLENVTNPSFQSVYTHEQKYYFQQFHHNGSMISSTLILTEDDRYFNYAGYRQNSSDVLTFRVGKVLSDSTHATNRHLIFYNITSKEIIKEIEMEMEIGSYYPTDDGLIAPYSEGSQPTLGKFNYQGDLIEDIGSIEGFFYQFLGPKTVLVGSYSGQIGQSFGLFISLGLLGIMILILLIHLGSQYLNKRKHEEDLEQDKYMQ